MKSGPVAETLASREALVALQERPARASVHKLLAYLELTKPRITVLLLLVAMAGFWLGSQGTLQWGRMLHTIVGVSLLASGIFALNQYLERDLDAVMRRTEDRPLPTGKLRPEEALWFGIVITVLGILYLARLVNLLSGLVALLTATSYLFLYTPLKRKTPHCTLIGAFPGATPPLVGWAAARGELGVEAWTLFAILFLWQFPHFHSIAWLYREDYARAGVFMWPVIEPEWKVTSRQILGFSALLLPVSLLPALLGVSGTIYFCGAAMLGGAFFYLGVRTVIEKSKWQAQRLLLASVLYLPVLLMLMVMDKS
jgi:heme o synthase